MALFAAVSLATNNAGAGKKVEPTGRVFLRESVTKGDPNADEDYWTSDVVLDSARLGLTFEFDERKMRAQVEAELSDDGAEVVDAFVEFRPGDRVRVKVGRFKTPFSAVALASKWELPVIERGMLSTVDFNTVRLPLGGRSEGAQVELRLPGISMNPSFTAGAFRTHAELNGENVSSSVDLGDSVPVDPIARLSLRPARAIAVGLSGAHASYLATPSVVRSELSGVFRHGLIGGLDASIDVGGFRGWVELFAGKSPLPIGRAPSSASP